MRDFQNTLKDVLNDEGGAEETMKQMQQMMQFIEKGMSDAQASEPSQTQT